MSSLLHPKIYHTGNRHYRVNPSRHDNSTDLTVPVGHLEEEPEDDGFVQEEESGDELNVKIVQEDHHFVCRIRVPSRFHGFLVGQKQTTLKNMEMEFSCQIKMPPRSSGSCEVLVKSHNEFNVRNACRRIRWLEYTARNRSRPSHYISLRCDIDNIQDAFTNFRDQVLKFAKEDSNGDFCGVEPGLFPSGNYLHFTLVTLLLADTEEVSTACDLLKEFLQSDKVRSLISAGPFRLTLQGLEFMNDDPSAVDVLYAKIAPSADQRRLQEFANALHSFYSTHNLVCGIDQLPQKDVCLHMTVMNSLYLCRDDPTKSRKPFSVRGVMREFGDFQFGDSVLFDRCELFIMMSEAKNENPQPNFVFRILENSDNPVSIELCDPNNS